MGRITAVTLLEHLMEKLKFWGIRFVSVYHSQVLVCPLQEVQFADVEDYELCALSVNKH